MRSTRPVELTRMCARQAVALRDRQHPQLPGLGDEQLPAARRHGDRHRRSGRRRSTASDEAQAEQQRRRNRTPCDPARSARASAPSKLAKAAHRRNRPRSPLGVYHGRRCWSARGLDSGLGGRGRGVVIRRLSAIEQMPWYDMAPRPRSVAVAARGSPALSTAVPPQIDARRRRAVRHLPVRLDLLGHAATRARRTVRLGKIHSPGSGLELLALLLPADLRGRSVHVAGNRET
ncbi:hypothetical protein DB30_02827 [Enhygromyxa salina]|uniref:Uncharacterized protein n=1 Tax=Enhygromyxa salina TaxID=215803 RepID=A0A0C1ZJZ7_9BACT|nr:hypothetical protein DB30_02827 [Enhygromyxa salina]